MQCFIDARLCIWENRQEENKHSLILPVSVLYRYAIFLFFPYDYILPLCKTFLFSLRGRFSRRNLNGDLCRSSICRFSLIKNNEFHEVSFYIRKHSLFFVVEELLVCPYYLVISTVIILLWNNALLYKIPQILNKIPYSSVFMSSNRPGQLVSNNDFKVKSVTLVVKICNR